MRRPWALLVAGIVLLFFGAGLLAVSLPAELDDPAHYDGDGNDAGGVRKPVGAGPVVVSTDLGEAFTPARWSRRVRPAQPTEPPPDPLPSPHVSRAPPA